MSPCAADISQECFLFHKQKHRGLFFSFLSLLSSISPFVLPKEEKGDQQHKTKGDNKRD